MFRSSFARFFATSSRGRFQTMRGFAVLDEAAGGLFGIAEFDLGAGRTRRAEGKPAKLQLGGGLAARSS